MPSQDPHRPHRPGALARASEHRRMQALLREVTRDFLLREELVTEPIGLIAEYVRKEKLAPATAQAADLLVYSIASSPPVLRQMVALFKDPAVDEAAFVRELSRAAAAARDTSTVLALARSAGLAEPLRYELAITLLGALLETTHAQSSSETEAGTATGPATQPATSTSTATATATATETAPATATETAPATATETAPATETQTSPATETVTITASTETLFPDTEITGVTTTSFTAPLTDPVTLRTWQTIFTNATFAGPFTEDVSSHLDRIAGEGERLVHLPVVSALVQYATHLRASGALDQLESD